MSNSDLISPTLVVSGLVLLLSMIGTAIATSFAAEPDTTTTHIETVEGH